MICAESLLSAHLFLRPRRAGSRLYFVSNLSGRFSLYAMDIGGSAPEPLLPPHIGLPNPALLDAESFCLLPRLGKLLVMIDQDGDERYRPMLIPVEGGVPVPAFEGQFEDQRVNLSHSDPKQSIVYLAAESLTQAVNTAYRGRVDTGELRKLGESPWMCYPEGGGSSHELGLVAEQYADSDVVLYLWKGPNAERMLLYGKPMEKRPAREEVPLSGISHCVITHDNRGVLCSTALFVDTFGLGYLRLDEPGVIRPVHVVGTAHTGAGELDKLWPVKDDRYVVHYNVDGCSWAYEGRFDSATLTMELESIVCGQGRLADGVLESLHYDPESDSYALAYSSATSPVQLCTIEGPARDRLQAHKPQSILDIPRTWLSPGKDASFDSFDGQRISARIYLPAAERGFQGPRPLIYYIHGGPQGQERPDFTWFSMPLIQLLTLLGFAVFVPNARGSTGYGLSYSKQVNRDWGGKDRLDHIRAMEVLSRDPRVDVTRTGVVGRSYGGYMTLTLAGRHPERWAAAVDMFGPYNLLTFSSRIPESWKPYFAVSVGNAEMEEERAFLVERSPSMYLDALRCPLLVIQGANDPRVVERESRELVEELRNKGKEVEYLVFEDEGHDILEFPNRVRCYNAIGEFFAKHLRP